ncbi:heme transporter FLVCR2 [Hydra vulgaris]|uniref:heme transporter FLVCR2 n=1 Tax=Hydra vulgaris TaxID=6087 RepID=UPI001F5E640C|nr:feline leukemia virus subgroup C receptor-related protein 2-like [Hydra vulgaris]
MRETIEINNIQMNNTEENNYIKNISFDDNQSAEMTFLDDETNITIISNESLDARISTKCEIQLNYANDSSTAKGNNYMLYKRRWLVLLSYCTLTTAVTTTSTSFPAISNILEEFYQVKPFAIHMLLGMYAFLVVLFNLPSSYLLHKFELAFVMKMSGTLNLIGGVIRYFSYSHNGYYFLLTGNFFSGLSLAALLFLTPKLAVNWFAKNEIGRVIGVCVGFDMFSAALGFLHSTNVVENTKNYNNTKAGIRSLVLHQLIMGCVAFFLTLICVKSFPVNPPSYEAEQLRKNKSKKLIKKQILECKLDKSSLKKNKNEDNQHSFIESIKKLYKLRNFVLIVHIIAVSASLEYSFGAILNNVLIGLFPGKEKDIGLVGFTSIILGFIANVIVGVILDKTKNFKLATKVIFLLSICFLAMWTCFLELYHSFVAISISYCCFIMTSTSYYSVAYTHMVSETHPISPEISCMVLMVASTSYVIAVVFLSSLLLEHYSILHVNLAALIITVGAALLSFLF